MKLLISPLKGSLAIRQMVMILLIVGSLSIIGCQGPQGPQGEVGPQGLPGLPGQDGRPGLTGLQGPVAEQGLQGPQGERGESGLVGLQGPAGERGAEGPQGLTGEQGRVGPKGEKGLEGSQGEIGPAGSKDAVLQVLASGTADIKARSIELVDELGATRIKLSTDGWPSIELFDAQGARVISIRDFFGTPSIVVYDPSDPEKRAQIQVLDGIPTLTVKSGESATSLAQNSWGGQQSFFDNTGTIRADISVLQTGRPSFAMADTAGNIRTLWAVFESGDGQLQFKNASQTTTDFVP